MNVIWSCFFNRSFKEYFDKNISLGTVRLTVEGKKN